MSSNPQSSSINPSSSTSHTQSYLLILVLIASTVLFFTSILPRIPRLVLRGPLRIKRAGLRGIRGLEFSQNGFKSNSDSKGEKNKEDGLNVRVAQIKPIFFWNEWNDQKSSTSGDEADKSSRKRRKALVTIYIKGVSILLPSSSSNSKSSSDSEKSKTDKEVEKKRKEKEFLESEKEKNEERLRILLQSPPLSPSLSATHSDSAPTFTDFSALDEKFNFQANPSTRTASTSNQTTSSSYYPTRSSINSKYNSILHLLLINFHLLLPKVKRFGLRSAKTGLYLIASTLPILASLIDVRIENVEILHSDSGLITKIDRLETGFQMKLVRKQGGDSVGCRKNPNFVTSKNGDVENETEEEQEDETVCMEDSSDSDSSSTSDSGERASPKSKKRSLYPISSTLSTAFLQMPGKVGRVGKSGLNYLLSGIPAGKGSIELQVFGFEVIESGSLKDGKISNQQPSTEGDARTSNSKDRWSEWAFSNRVSIYSAIKTRSVPTRSKVLEIKNLSVKSSILMGQSFTIQNEAIDCRIRIPEIEVGLDALFKVVEEVQKKKQREVNELGQANKEESSRFEEVENEEAAKEETDRDETSILQASKQLENIKRKNPVASSLLSLLGTFSLSIPIIQVGSSSHIPSNHSPSSPRNLNASHSVQLNTIFRKFKFNLKTSDHGDKLHQYWLGTCGIKDKSHFSHSDWTHSYRNRLGGIAQRIWKSTNLVDKQEEKIPLIENRRVLQLDFNLSSVETSFNMGNQKQEKMINKSQLVDLRDFRIHLRSTWTPFGILPSSSCSSLDHRHQVSHSDYFESDPNEQAIVGEIGIQQVRGDVKLEHIEVLLKMVELRKRQVTTSLRKEKSNSSSAHSPKKKSSPGDASIKGLPRLAISLEIKNCFYQINSRRRETPANPNAPTNSTLIISLPKINSVFHGNYKESFVRRPEVDRRNGWKAFNKNKLEFDVYSTDKVKDKSGNESTIGNRRGSFLFGNKSQDHEKQKEKDQDENAIVEEPSEMDSPQDEFLPSPIPIHDLNVNLPQKKAMTMDEALKEMKELQAKESNRSGSFSSASFKRASFSSATSTTSNREAKPQKKSSLNSTTNSSSKSKPNPGFDEMNQFNVNYHFESNLRLESFDVYLKTPATLSNSYFENQDTSPSSSTSSTPSEGNGSRIPKAPITPGGPSGLNMSEHHLISLHHLEVSLNAFSSGVQDQFTNLTSFKKDFTSFDVTCALEDIDIELWRPAVLESCSALIDVLANSKDGIDPTLLDEDRSVEVEESERDEKESLAIIDKLPANLTVYFTIGLVVAHVGGNDARCDAKISRGVGFESKRVVLEYTHRSDKLGARSIGPSRYSYGSRSALDLPEDIKISALAHASRHGRSAMAKVNLYEIGLFPILDADQAVKLQEKEPKENPIGKNENVRVKQEEQEVQNEQKEAVTPSVFAPAVWDFQNPSSEEIVKKKRARKMFRQNDRSNFIFYLPFSATVVTIRPPGSISSKVGKSNDEVTIVTEHTQHISIKIELLHTYCLLVAVASLRSLIPKGSADGQSIRTSPKSEKPNKSKKSSRPSIHASLFISHVHCSVALPHFVNLFLAMRRVDVRFTEAEGFSISWESLMGAGETAQAEAPPDLWEEIARLRDWKIVIGRKDHQVEDAKRIISVNGDVASIRIPYNYVLHDVIENALVAFKATKQLVHQFVSGKDGSIISPVAEDPKHLPKILVNLRILTLEAQDDPLETRLNLIWRAGSDEQAARAEREAAFHAKVESLKKQEKSKSKTSIATSFSTSASSSIDSSDDEDEEGRVHASAKAQLSTDEAQDRLDAFNSSSWIRRCTNARAEQGRREDSVLRRIHGRYPQGREASELPIKMAKASRTAPLIRSSMSNVALEVGPPSFPETELRDFLFEQGQGIPKDTKYSTLVPLGIRWRMSEWRVELRDYPLPLLHIPPMHRNQDDSLKSWDLQTNVVFGEELPDGDTATRHVPAVVVPAATGHPKAIEYGIMVPKVAMPVKCYGSPVVKINTSYPTRLVWGQSIQPTIQDVQRVFDTITSPPHDPSPRIGFWDKLPLIMHGKVKFSLEGEGDLHIYMKGARDPYNILGHGAGWVKCWRGNVDIRIGFENKDHEFFQITSNEYLLAIPDLKDYIDEAAAGASTHHGKSDDSDRKSYGHNSLASTSTRRYMKDPDFKKIVVRLTNGIRWGAGMQFEHTCTDDNCERSPKCQGTPFYRECRRFGRINHWEVKAKSKEYVDTLPQEEQEKLDSYEGWRSHHVHFSISVYSPEGGLPGYGDGDHQKKGSPNNFFFTPLAWEHFWAWTRLFSSAMGLPIRHGSLFPNTPAPSPKFGQHLGTLKYRFDLAPLFITHCYMQYNDADWANGTTTLLGVKARIGTFHLDFHQRQQETVKDMPQLGGPRKILHKPFYEAEVDCADIDLRTLVAGFREPDKRLVPVEDADEVEGTDLLAGDCQVPDSDLEWIDMNDFVELDWSPPPEETPRIKLGQALVCPRFNFYRHIDSKRERKARNARHHREEDSGEKEDSGSEDEDDEGPEVEEDKDDEEAVQLLERSKFGKEKTHTCLVGRGPSAPSVQADLAKDRLERVLSELEKLEHPRKSSISEHQDDETQETASADSSEKKDLVTDEERIEELHRKAELLTNFIENVQRVEEARKTGGKAHNPDRGSSHDAIASTNTIDVGALYRDWETFQQRFFIHNPTIFFNNSTRDVLLKYYLSSRARRGFCHQMTARALRAIRDLSRNSEDAQEGKSSSNRRKSDSSFSSSSSFSKKQEDGGDLLRDLLKDTMHYVEEAEDAHDMVREFTPPPKMAPGHGISKEFSINKSNVCVLLKPQIVLQSERDKDSSLVITAIRGRLQNYSVKDEHLNDESPNERALYRNFGSLDGLQCFHPNTECTSFLKPEHGRSGIAFVPLEVLIDSNSRSREFDRIVPLTDASMQYDKFNRLRMHDFARPVADSSCKDDASTDHLRYYMDLIKVRCPRFAVSANSTHFAALYNVVFDLLLYRDPTYKDHVKRLETMLFSYDFSDPAGLSCVVADLQNRIRHAGQLITQYQLNFEHLNDQGRLDFLSIKAEALELVRELSLIHEAIATSQDQAGKDKDKKSALRLEAHAQDIAWNMMGDTPGELLAKLALKGASFTWLSKVDNSTANTFSLIDLQALNVRPDAIFTEIVTKHNKVADHPMVKEGRFLNAMWSVMAPVGGIAIIDQFEFSLHPVKIQLEIKVGRQIMDYIFGSARRKEKEMEEKKKKEEEDEAAAALNRCPPYSETKKKKRKKANPFARLKAGHNDARDHSDDSNKSGSSSNGKDKDKPSSSTSRPRTSESRSRPSTSDSRKQVESEDSEDENSQMAITNKEAEEMRNRAAASSTFVYVKIAETTFCLSYKGEKKKSITDVYDLVFRGPTLEYRNRTWGYVDLANNFKRDIIRAAWSQKTTLLRGILSHRPRRKNTKENFRNAKLDAKQQGLTLNIEPPTPRGSLLTEPQSADNEDDIEEHGFGAHAAQAYQDDLQDSDQDDDDDDEENEGENEEEEREPISTSSSFLTSSQSEDLSSRSDNLRRSLSGKSIGSKQTSSRPTTSGSSTASPSRLGFFMKRLGRNRSGSGSSSTLMGSVGAEESPESSRRISSSQRSSERNGEDSSVSDSFSSSPMHKSSSGDLMPPPATTRSPERSRAEKVGSPSSSLRKSQSVSALREAASSSTSSLHSESHGSPSSSSASLRNVLRGSPSKNKLRLETKDLSRRSSQESSRSSLFGKGNKSPSKKNSPFEEMSDDEKKKMLLG